MDSTLILVSEKNKGSIFTFTLKLAYVHDSAPVVERPVLPYTNLEGINILLVEDNQINMMVAKKCITGFKGKVTSAYNGAEALYALKQTSDYQIILMDLDMPVMNGYVAIAEINRLYPTIPVVAFTASLVDDKMLAELLAKGFVDYISKPFEARQVLATILKQLKADAPIS